VLTPTAPQKTDLVAPPPALITAAGDRARVRFFEFFAASPFPAMLEPAKRKTRMAAKPSAFRQR
jgi:hypothetical protein